MRATFALTVDRAWEAINSRRFRAASALLARAPALSNVERRIRAHLLGLVRFRMGEIAAAFRAWEEAERRYGPNVLLVADMMEALRTHGSADAFQAKACAFQAEFEKAELRLSNSSRDRARLVLGHEELEMAFAPMQA